MIEEGSPERLVESGGAYARMVDQQENSTSRKD
jgi:ABC-type multidrug transport system fused ATPase/permease subunit